MKNYHTGSHSASRRPSPDAPRQGPPSPPPRPSPLAQLSAVRTYASGLRMSDINKRYPVATCELCALLAGRPISDDERNFLVGYWNDLSEFSDIWTGRSPGLIGWIGSPAGQAAVLWCNGRWEESGALTAQMMLTVRAQFPDAENIPLPVRRLRDPVILFNSADPPAFEDAVELDDETLEDLPQYHDFGDGAGPVLAHVHQNGGGWVADSCYVEPGVLIDSASEIFGDARIFDKAEITGSRIGGLGISISGFAVIGACTIVAPLHMSEEAAMFDSEHRFGYAEIFGKCFITHSVLGSCRIYDDAIISHSDIDYDAEIGGMAVLNSVQTAAQGVVLNSGNHTGLLP